MSNFSDRDLGWKKFMAAAKVNGGETAGFAGYLRSSGEHKPKANQKAPKQPITVAQIAAIMEFGSSDGTIPERPFMRSALGKSSKMLKRLTKKIATQVVDGKLDKKRGIGIICQKMIDLFADSIDSNIPPELEDETIRRKGSSHTLIDTGQLKNSLDWEIKKGNK